MEATEERAVVGSDDISLVIKTEPIEVEIEYDCLGRVETCSKVGPKGEQGATEEMESSAASGASVEKPRVLPEYSIDILEVDVKQESTAGTETVAGNYTIIFNHEDGQRSTENELSPCASTSLLDQPEGSLLQGKTSWREFKSDNIFSSHGTFKTQRTSTKKNVNCPNILKELKTIKSHPGKPLLVSQGCGTINISEKFITNKSIHPCKKLPTCQECGKSFSRMSNLRTHMRTHTGERPHTCQECGASFSQTSNLRIHMKIHTGEKPHSCQECSKSFGEASDLRKHMIIHTRDTPHTCHECGKSFSRTSNLHIHMRSHTGETPPTCQECGKSFDRMSNLRTHMRIHTGEKPYTCQECGMCFSQTSHLRTHMKSHTGVKPHTCQQCCKSFSERRNLLKHVKVHSKLPHYL